MHFSCVWESNMSTCLLPRRCQYDYMMILVSHINHTARSKAHYHRSSLKYYTIDLCDILFKIELCGIIYVVIRVAWQYQLSKTLVIFSTMIILSLSWWFTSIWWEYNVSEQYFTKFAKIGSLANLISTHLFIYLLTGKKF